MYSSAIKQGRAIILPEDIDTIPSLILGIENL